MYKNSTKNKARNIIWKQSIDTVTKNKNEKTVITDKNIQLYWEHIKNLLNEFNILDLKNTEYIIEKFLSYKNTQIKDKTLDEVKVLFFCGPEPENDIEILLNNGILEENIWVVELDDSTFLSAIDIIKYVYPSVKIFKTKIENLFQVIKTKFDIVYLDYTAPFFSKSQKPYKTTMELYKYNIINDFGVLITNYSEINPEDTHFDDNLKTMYDYFYNQESVHELKDFEPGSYLECPSRNEFENFKSIVKENYEGLYSYFLTHFHLYLSEIITPAKNIFQNPSMKNMLFDEKGLKEFIKKTQNYNAEDFDELFTFGDRELNPTAYWFEHFVDDIKGYNHHLYSYIEDEKINWSINLLNLLKEIYSEDKFSIVNKKTFQYILQTQKNLLDTKGGYFCDVPMIHLWYSLLINQLGAPYHVNLENHKRFSYTGNTRKMYVDIFTLDKCRYFYDWIPSIFTLPESMLNVGKQILIRIVIDIIRKQHQFYLFDESYQFGNMICYNDDGVDFLKENYISDRYNIVLSESEKKDTFESSFEEMFSLAHLLSKRIEKNFCKSFSSFKNFHPTYTMHAYIWLEVKKVPTAFKVFGKKFTKYKIAEKYNFEYNSECKQLYFKSKCILNGSEKFDLMIHETINSIFKRYGLECNLINHPD